MHHHNLLLIINRSWILTVQKKLLKKTFLAFQNGVKNIQTAGYNGAHTVPNLTLHQYNFWIFKSALNMCDNQYLIVIVDWSTTILWFFGQYVTKVCFLKNGAGTLGRQAVRPAGRLTVVALDWREGAQICILSFFYIFTVHNVSFHHFKSE